MKEEKVRLSLNYVELTESQIEAFRQLCGYECRTIKKQLEYMIINELKKDVKHG